MNDESDGALVRRTCNGEPRAFEGLVRQHYAAIARAALMLAGDPWEAEDLAQEVFLVAQRRLPTFVARAPVLGWLYGILRNLHLKSAGKRRRRDVAPDPPDGARAPTAEPLAELMRDEAHAALWGALSRLEPKLREAIVLKYIEGLSQQEIAEAAGVPVGTVKSRIGAGLAELRRILGPVEMNEREP